MILHQSTSPEAGNVGNFCRPAQLCLHFQTLDSFLSWSACLVQDTISLAESERGGRWGGESLFVWKINADSRDLPPPAWHPGQVGYVCINKHLPPPPSLRPGPNRRRERDRREEEVSSERYLSLGDLLGGEGQPRGRLACQFRQQSFLPLPLPLNNGTGHSQGTSFCSPPSAYLIYKKAFLELAVVSVAKKEAFPFFLFGGAFSRLGNLI